MNSTCKGDILLLGEGNFSFSAAFVKGFNDPSIITASSLLSEVACFKLHSLAETSVCQLKEQGVKVDFEVDATKLHSTQSLAHRSFFRIIFNFPHIGGKSKITKNRELLSNFFKSASQKLDSGGEICVTLAQGQGGTPADHRVREWHDSWQVVAVASSAGFILTDVQPFNIEDYPDYCSTGFRSEDKSFFTKGALTYIFHKAPTLPLPSQTISSKIFIGNEQYDISAHVGHYFKRNLFDEADSEISKTKECLVNALESQFSSLETAASLSPLVNRSTAKDCYPLTQTDSQADFSLMSSLLCKTTELLSTFAHEKCALCYASPVYRRPCIATCDVPVQYEVIVIDRNDVTEKVKSVLTSMFSDCNQSVLNPVANCEVISDSPWHNSSYSTVEISYVSKNAFYMSSCNHVTPTGPAEAQNSRSLNKMPKLSMQVCSFGELSAQDSSLHAVVFNLNSIAQVLFDIPDQRSLLDCPDFRGLFSPMWRHDLSFWENAERDFNEVELLDIIRSVAGRALKQVLLMNRWEEPGTGRISRCYRQIYQSDIYAVSHADAHRLQNAVRLTVRDQLGVELR